MVDLGVLGLVLLVALGVGRRLVRAVPFPWALEEGLAALALGLGLLAYVTLALGLAGLLYRPILLAALVAGAWYGRREAAAGVALARRGLGRWRHAALEWSERGAVALGIVLALAEIVPLLAPPVGGDQTKYHLVYPRLYAEAHRIVATPWSFWGYLQYLANMLFTAAFVLRGDVLARLVNAAFGIMAALAVFALGRRLFSRRVGVWAAILFATMPLTATLTIRAWAELPLALYVVLAVLGVLAWESSGVGAWLGLAAVMAGFAAGTKVIGLLVPALLGALVLAVGASRLGAARGVAATLRFGLVAAVVASPCYLRNAVQTGNPIFPFGYGVLDGRDWNAAAAAGLDRYYAAYREAQAAKRGGHAYRRWYETVRFPWDMTMAPHSFEESGRSAYDVGPFVLAFAPGVALLGRARRAWAVTGIAAAYAAVVALAMWAHPRYVHPALPLLLVVSAAVADRCRAYGTPAARVVGAVVAITVTVQTALVVRVVSPRWVDSARVALGRMSGDTFLRRHDARYPLAALVHARVPTDGNVAVFAMIPHPYHYLDRHFTLASPLEQTAIDYRRIDTVDELMRALRGFGVTHVVREADPENKDFANPIGPRVVRLWDDLVAGCAKLGEVEAGALYRLPAESGGPA